MWGGIIPSDRGGTDERTYVAESWHSVCRNRTWIVGRRVGLLRCSRREGTTPGDLIPNLERDMAMDFSPGTTKVGWIGVGVMGSSMCGHLLSAGYKATVYNRSRSDRL